MPTTEFLFQSGTQDHILEITFNFVAKYLIPRLSRFSENPIELDQGVLVNAAAKVLKSIFWATVVLGPIFYFGAKALPMVTESIEFTRKMHAQNTKKSQDKLDALAEVDHAIGSAELAPSDDPNLALTESEQIANKKSADGDRVATQTAGLSSAPQVNQPSLVAAAKPATIEITNDNMNSFWDPAAEDRIQNMAISAELKRQILENYRRTGVLPEAVASTRKPASINR